MEKAKITWYILDNGDYIQDDEYYCGSYDMYSEITINAQVWNNRYGKNSVESINNSRLAIYFDTLEDSMLLNYCYVSINNEGYSKVNTISEKGIVEIGSLSGNSNNGLDDIDNSYNFKNISVMFKGFPHNLKNGIKNVYLDIELD